MLRRRVIAPFKVCVSATSTTKRFLTIGGVDRQRASTMFAPDSENARERSSSRRWRAPGANRISTTKGGERSPAPGTRGKRYGFLRRKALLGPDLTGVVIPRSG